MQFTFVTPMDHQQFDSEKGAPLPSPPTRNGSSLRLRARRRNSGCCQPGQVKPCRLPTIRLITSGHAGSRTPRASSSPGTSRGAAYGSIRRMFPEENPTRFPPKGSTQWHLLFRRMASWSRALAPIKKGTSTPRREVTLESLTVWNPEIFPSIGVRTPAPFIFFGPARCPPRFIDWNWPRERKPSGGRLLRSIPPVSPPSDLS